MPTVDVASVITHSEDSPMAANGDPIKQALPMATIFVAQNDISAFVSTLIHMMQRVGNVDAI